MTRPNEAAARSPKSALDANDFIGREDEIGQIRAAAKRTARGRGGLILIAGEPGIGKTRLAVEATQYARGTGLLTLWGRCWEAGGGVPAYWPWIQVLRTANSHASGDGVARHVPPESEDITLLLADGAPRPPAKIAMDGAQARFRLFDAVNSYLAQLSARQPLLIVIDDLHVGDPSSLLLLSFIAGDLQRRPILVVCTYRDAEVRRSRALAAALAESARYARRISLGGFEPAEIRELLTARTGHEPDYETCQRIHQTTGGNPLFVTEFVALGDLGDSSARNGFRLQRTMPQGIKAVIALHLKPLDTDVRILLATAAVMGREFETRVLEEATGLRPEQVEQAMTQARAAGLIDPRGPGGTSYSFRHDLIREHLCDALPAGRRIRLHRQIAQSLERIYGDALELHLDQLAHHFFEGSRDGCAAPAVEYCRRAAARAAATLAFGEAAELFEMALKAFDRLELRPPMERCELLLALGAAQEEGGNREGAKFTFSAAAGVAIELGDADRLAVAAMGRAGMQWAHPGIIDRETLHLFEQAARMLGDKESPLLVSLLARWASELHFLPEFRAERDALLARARQIAHRLKSEEATALAALAQFDSLSGPDTAEQMLRASSELVSLGKSVSNYPCIYIGFLGRAMFAARRGDLEAADHAIAAALLCEKKSGWPIFGWGPRCFASSRAFLLGRFAEGEEIANECLTLSRRLGRPEAVDFHWPQLVMPFYERNRLTEIAPMAEQSATQRPNVAFYSALLARIRFDLGDRNQARREFDTLMRSRLPELPRDTLFLPTLAALSELHTRMESNGVAQLYETMLPYADLNPTFGVVVAFGAANLYLGRLAMLLERPANAAHHFEAALKMNRKMNALPWLAYTQYDYARLLLELGNARDQAKARDLLAQACTTAQIVGMKHLFKDASRLGAVARKVKGSVSKRPPSQPQNASQSMLTIKLYTDRQDLWTVIHGDSTLQLKPSKGLRIIDYLISNPGREFHVLELTRVAAPDGSDIAVGLDSAVADSVLDARAKRAYREHIESLRDELQQARSFNDLGRIEKLEHELALITRELSNAVGHSGRDRKLGSAAERARVRVTNAIRDAIKKIVQEDQSAGWFLQATIRTGNYCSYQPTPDRQRTDHYARP